jgi:hypothetical protein
MADHDTTTTKDAALSVTEQDTATARGQAPTTDHDSTIAKDEASTADHRSTTSHDGASTTISPQDDASAALQPYDLKDTDLRYIQYDSSHEEHYLPLIRSLISKDLSEPYSIYVYRYFLYQWGDLCYMVYTLPTFPHRKSLPLTTLPI